MSKATYAVIMAGGSGTRFWPASRRHHPKQLLPLAGEQTLLRETVRRLGPLCDTTHLRIATGSHLATATLAELPELSPEQLLVEPAARNTAPCIGWAAATIARTDPEAVIMALPSDHHIADVAAFHSCLQQAVESARSGVITAIGIKPDRPETGFGYIEATPRDGATVQVVKRFVEKPDRVRAQQFLEAGNFYWNAGMFFFRACDMLAAIALHQPELAAGLTRLDQAAAEGREAALLSSLFPALPAISIDHGVMERLDNMAVVPGDFGWSDLGSWQAASELAPTDEAGNNLAPNAMVVQSEGNYVVDMRTDETKRVIALVGVSDLVVVETADALLIVHKDATQQVREVVEKLKAQGDEALV